MNITQPTIERHTDGLPILRGMLDSVGFFTDSDDPTREEPQAIIKILCPCCCGPRGGKRYHYHGWSVGDGFDAISHRSSHCANPILRDKGYYIGLDPNAAHIVPPGVPQYRPARTRQLLIAGVPQ
jgi:hypothetical protein